MRSREIQTRRVYWRFCLRRKNRAAFLTERVPDCPWMKGPVFISEYLLFFLCQTSSDYSLGSVLNLPSCSIVQCSFSSAGLAHMRVSSAESIPRLWELHGSRLVVRSLQTCLLWEHLYILQVFCSITMCPRGSDHQIPIMGSLVNIESICGICVLS